jgi:beta-phosphoglucomutase
VVDGNAVTASKPDPEIFLRCAAALGVMPEHCLVFEDAIAGITAAHAAGMKVIGVGSPEVLTAADQVIPGLWAMNIDMLNV